MEAFSRLYLNDYELLKDKNDVYGVLISVFFGKRQDYNPGNRV